MTMPRRQTRDNVPSGTASRIYLKVAPLRGGKTEVKHASRVSLDGSGGLVLWEGGRKNGRLRLDRVCIVQMLVVQHTRTGAPAHHA
jgi:hypothetical protein